MEWNGVEIEIQVPCAEGQTHPVRLRFTGWGEYEVAYNPCEELLGPVFARMAACTHYLHEEFPKVFRRDTDLKRRLVEALRAAGAPAVPALIQALWDSDRDVRRAAAWALGELGDPQAVPALTKALGDWNGGVRRAAAEALAKIGTPAVPALIQALGYNNWRVHKAAAEALGELGDPQAVPALLQALGDWNTDVRRAACEALGKLGDLQAVPALSVWAHAGEDAARNALQALGHPVLDLPQAVAQIAAQGVWEVLIRALLSEKVREAVVGLGAPAVPALIRALALGDWDEYVRRAACEALGAIGDPQAVPALIQALGHRKDVRRAAAEALGKLGDPDAVPALSVWAHAGEDAAHNALQAIGHPALELSRAVAQVAAQGAWSMLIRALWNEEVREAVVGLGAPAVPALIQALGDSEWEVRCEAAEALGAIGDPQAVPALIQALGDWNWDVRRTAAAALGAIGDPQAVPALIQALGDSSYLVCEAAAAALGKLGDPQAVPALSVWAHAGEDAAHNALQAIGHPALELSQAVAQVAAQGAWSVLIRALWNEEVREAVVGLGAPAVPALRQALGDWDSSDSVRRAAAEALGAIGDPQAVPALIQALGDENR